MTNIVIPRTWLKPSMVLSVLGFGLCLAVIADVFVGTASLFAAVVMPLFVAVFPLYFGAVSISVRRMKSDRRTAWKVLFRGLPSWFLPAFHCYFYIVGLGMLTGFVQLFRGKPAGLVWHLCSFHPSSIWLRSEPIGRNCVNGRPESRFRVFRRYWIRPYWRDIRYVLG